MRNPFGSEPAAFRFALLTLAAFATVAAAAAAAGTWAGLAAFALVTASALALAAGSTGPGRGLRTAPAHAGSPDDHSVVVVAAAPLPDDAAAEIAGRAGHVVVLAPVAPTRLQRWVSDLDPARATASALLTTSVGRFRTVDADVVGLVGDDDPLQAVEDALRAYGGDEILVAGGEGLASSLRRRFALPVTRLGA